MPVFAFLLDGLFILVFRAYLSNLQFSESGRSSLSPFRSILSYRAEIVGEVTRFSKQATSFMFLKKKRTGSSVILSVVRVGSQLGCVFINWCFIFSLSSHLSVFSSLSPQFKSSYELIVGSATDPQMGPVVLFGAGGTMVEVRSETVETV